MYSIQHCLSIFWLFYFHIREGGSWGEGGKRGGGMLTSPPSPPLTSHQIRLTVLILSLDMNVVKGDVFNRPHPLPPHP